MDLVGLEAFARLLRLPIFALAALAGCASPQTNARGGVIGINGDASTLRAADLVGSPWGVVRVGDTLAPRSSRPAATLAFDSDGRVSGTHACNHLSTSLRIVGNRIEPGNGDGIITTAGCGDPEAGAFADLLVARLPMLTRWEGSGDRVLLFAGDRPVVELRRLRHAAR